MNSNIIPAGPTETITNGTVTKKVLMMFAETDVTVSAISYNNVATASSVPFTLKAGRYLCGLASIVFVGTATLIYFSIQDAAPQASVLVFGAGTAAANGLYTPRGFQAGKPYYNLVGKPDDIDKFSIVRGSFHWLITDNTGAPAIYYRSTAVDLPYPWMATWTLEIGSAPLPNLASQY